MQIREAVQADVPAIHHLAHQTWWPTYSGFLPAEQIEFMLGKMYTEEALKQQMFEGIVFLMAEDEGRNLAFAAYSETEPENKVFKIHKLYVHPDAHGMGLGRKLIEEISRRSKIEGGKILELNVNRYNKAFDFYRKLGFEIYQTLDIQYYEYVLNDYVMRKSI